MYALSIHPEYARAIVAGTKRIENRSWRTHYRGPLLIHATKPVGAFIGIVDLVDVVPLFGRPGQRIIWVKFKLPQPGRRKLAPCTFLSGWLYMTGIGSKIAI